MCFMNCEEQNVVVRKYDYEGDDQGHSGRGAKEVSNCKALYKSRLQIKKNDEQTGWKKHFREYRVIGT